MRARPGAALRRHEALRHLRLLRRADAPLGPRHTCPSVASLRPTDHRSRATAAALKRPARRRRTTLTWTSCGPTASRPTA